MNITEAYSFLFCDSFFSALILTPRSELVIKLMTTFSGYNIYAVFILAITGSIFGSIANWQIGRFFLFLHNTEFFKNNAAGIAKAEVKWHKFLVYILLLSWISAIGNPFTVLAGFFKTNFKKFLLLVFVGKFFYYYIFVFHDLDLLKIFA